MATIRAKLTVAYTGALIGSLAVFSIALYAARRSTARRDAQREVTAKAEQAKALLRFAVSAAAQVNEPVTADRDPLDPLVGVEITPRVQAILDRAGINRSDRIKPASPA